MLFPEFLSVTSLSCYTTIDRAQQTVRWRSHHFSFTRNRFCRALLTRPASRRPYEYFQAHDVSRKACRALHTTPVCEPTPHFFGLFSAHFFPSSFAEKSSSLSVRCSGLACDHRVNLRWALLVGQTQFSPTVGVIEFHRHDADMVFPISCLAIAG